MGQTEKHGKNLTAHQQHGVEQREKIAELYTQHAGHVPTIARALGLARSTVWEHLQKLGIKKPIAGGKQRVVVLKETKPATGNVKRYILTSAQNNTLVHADFWANVKAMAQHYDARIMVGTFSYNQNGFGKSAVKQGTKKPFEPELWYDPELTPYFCDKIVELAPGLTWYGSMNILPTEDNPISGLESHGGASSVIFPHTKIEMRSIATTPDNPAKHLYTTGAVTLMNYLQKKLGIKAEHHHRYAFLLVEVDSEGNWWVRQVAARKNGKTIQDLNVLVSEGKVQSTSAPVSAITWGDLHATNAEPAIVDASQEMLDALQPVVQVLHDVLEGVSINRHTLKHAPVPHEAYHRYLRGLSRVEAELKITADVARKYLRSWCLTIAPDANHDAPWLHNWLSKYDYRYDPANSELFLDMQNFMYAELKAGKLPKNVNLMQYAMERWGGLGTEEVRFLLPDESFVVDEVELALHGHLGPNGSFGSPQNLSKIGKKATTAHTHSASIVHGLYTAGTSSKLTTGWQYTSGPSSWSWSHVVQYDNGQRTLVTMKLDKNGKAKWKA
jgi:hypothetical protein